MTVFWINGMKKAVFYPECGYERKKETKVAVLYNFCAISSWLLSWLTVLMENYRRWFHALKINHSPNHRFSALRQVSWNLQLAVSFPRVRPFSLTMASNWNRLLPLSRFPHTIPSIISMNKHLHLIQYSIHFLFLFVVTSKVLHVSFTRLKTCSFNIVYCHLTHFILPKCPLLGPI